MDNLLIHQGQQGGILYSRHHQTQGLCHLALLSLTQLFDLHTILKSQYWFLTCFLQLTVHIRMDIPLCNGGEIILYTRPPQTSTFVSNVTLTWSTRAFFFNANSTSSGKAWAGTGSDQSPSRLRRNWPWMNLLSSVLVTCMYDFVPLRLFTFPFIVDTLFRVVINHRLPPLTSPCLLWSCMTWMSPKPFTLIDSNAVFTSSIVALYGIGRDFCSIYSRVKVPPSSGVLLPFLIVETDVGWEQLSLSRSPADSRNDIIQQKKLPTKFLKLTHHHNMDNMSPGAL